MVTVKPPLTSIDRVPFPEIDIYTLLDLPPFTVHIDLLFIFVFPREEG